MGSMPSTVPGAVDPHRAGGRVAARALLVLLITGAAMATAHPQGLPAAVAPLAIRDLKGFTEAGRGDEGRARKPVLLGESQGAEGDTGKLAAMQVLDTHCARCHQSDRLVGRFKPAKGFGNILDMDALAANPKYIKPGDPDGSLLYHVMDRKEMPSDVFQDGDLDHPAPEPKEYAAMRAWIASLKPLERRDLEVAKLVAAPTLPALPRVPDPSPATLPAAAPDFVALAPAAQPASPVAGGAASPGVSGIAPRSIAGVQVASLSAEVPTDRSRMLLIETQKDLKRIGCLVGEVTGVSDEPTRAALARYNAVMGRGEEATPVTSDLLEELRSETSAICLPRPIVASTSPSGGFAIASPPPAPSSVVPRVDRPAVSPRPAARVAHATPDRPSAMPAPTRRASREQHLRQPSFRQADSRPTYRQAQRASGGYGGSSASASSASSTVSGLSGI